MTTTTLSLSTLINNRSWLRGYYCIPSVYCIIFGQSKSDTCMFGPPPSLPLSLRRYLTRYLMGVGATLNAVPHEISLHLSWYVQWYLTRHSIIFLLSLSVPSLPLGLYKYNAYSVAWSMQRQRSPVDAASDLVCWQMPKDNETVLLVLHYLREDTDFLRDLVRGRKHTHVLFPLYRRKGRREDSSGSRSHSREQVVVVGEVVVMGEQLYLTLTISHAQLCWCRRQQEELPTTLLLPSSFSSSS